jgi:hypothetical protein
MGPARRCHLQRPEPGCQVCWSCCQPTASEEDCPEEAIAEQAPILDLGHPLAAAGVRQRQGEACIVPCQQMVHCPWGDSSSALVHMRMDFGQTAMRCVTQGTNAYNDLKAKLMPREGQAALWCSAVGTGELRTGPGETAPDLYSAMHDVFQGRDRAIVRSGRPHRVTADGAMMPKRSEAPATAHR